MSNAKLIAEARTFAASYQREGMPLVADMITRVTDALEELEVENEGNASDSIHYSRLSEKLYNALHSVAPHAAKAILAEHA